MQRQGTRQQLTACLLLTLLFSSRVVSMRIQIKQVKTAAKFEKVLTEENLEKLVKEGDKIFAKLKCDELPGIMSDVLKAAMSSLLDICPPDESCNLASASEEQIEHLTYGATKIAAYAHVAEMKMCLGETMAHPSVAKAARALEDVWQTVLEGSGPRSVQKRMQQARQSLSAWKSDLVGLKGGVLDRKLFFPSSIEDAEHCPQPCASCTKKHNSWWKGDERFKFKCIFNREAEVLEPPSDPELKCSPVETRSWGKGHKSWCEVPDWKTSAYQKAGLVAKVTCGAQDILSPLHSGDSMPDSVMSTCLQIEEGKVVASDDMEEYKAFVSQTDGEVSKGAKVAFSIFMSLVQAEGIAELRRGAQGNQQDTNSSSIDEKEGFEDKCEPYDAPGIFLVVGKVLLAFLSGVLIGTFVIFPLVGVATAFLIMLALEVGVISMAGGHGAGMAAGLLVILGGGAIGILAGVVAGLIVVHKTWKWLKKDDCIAGEVRGGSCVAGLNFGETATVECKSGSASIIVSCNKQDGGAMTTQSLCPPK